MRAAECWRGQSLNQELLDHISLEIHAFPCLSLSLSPFLGFVLVSFSLSLDFVWPLIEPYH